MKVLILFEPMDCVPPKVVDAMRRSIANVMDTWGLAPSIDTNREKETEATQRWWKWVAEHGSGTDEA